jgi:small subunit ribosomal protein S8
MMTDPIADMLTRIRNAQAVGKATVVLPSSKLKRAIVELLAREGWLDRVETRPAPAVRRGGESVYDELVLHIRYQSPGQPAITSIRRMSRPGRRWYVKHGEVPRVKRGRGLSIMSTSQGLLTNEEARKRGVGGEVVCEVY